MRSLFSLLAVASFAAAMYLHWLDRAWTFQAYLSLWWLLNVITIDTRGKPDA